MTGRRGMKTRGKEGRREEEEEKKETVKRKVKFLTLVGKV